MLIEENKPLAPLTTFGIGGPARFFSEAASEEEIVEATAWAREHGAVVFVLGGGSNLLVSDAGFDGLVLRVALRGITVLMPEDTHTKASLEASGHDFSRAINAAKSTGALQAAEKLKAEGDGGFNPHAKPIKSTMALPTEECFSPVLLENPSFSAVSLAPEGHTIYQVAAGEDWEHFVQRAIDDNCAGIECLAGIPGTVGGTPVQNVGAYGQEVASAIERVRAFDLKERVFVEFTAAECGFSYRRSRFNSTDRGRYVVTRVDYRLTPGGAPTVRYAELQRALAEQGSANSEPTLAEVAALVRRLRQSKGMLLVEGEADCRSAGSFFKNPIVSEEQFSRIAAASKIAPPHFPTGLDEGSVKLSAAWLIEQAGFKKGYALGNAGISSRHTLALINRGAASATEVLALAAKIIQAVEARFGVRLEMEPVIPA
jgi:UDP-N-acetylmuramate dehydrogenase